MGGRDRRRVLRSCPPLTLRDTPDGVHLVGTAAGPLGGDDLHLDVVVGDGAALVVRSAAASIVLPGAHPGPSRSTVSATVGVDGSLVWRPQPTVLVQGCDHHMGAHVSLAASASLLWREELVLGRHGEAPGSVLHRLSVDVDSEPLHRGDLALGPRWPHWDGPAGTGPARAVGCLLAIGSPATALLSLTETVAAATGLRAEVMELGTAAALLLAVASTPGPLAPALDTWTEALGAAVTR